MYFQLQHLSWIFANQTFWTALDSWGVNLSSEQFPLFISGPDHLPPPGQLPLAHMHPDISPFTYWKSGQLPPICIFWIICEFFKIVFLTFFFSEHEFKICIILIAINILCARSANKLLYVVGDDPVIKGLSLLQLLYVVGDDPVIKGLSLLQLWKKPVTL